MLDQRWIASLASENWPCLHSAPPGPLVTATTGIQLRLKSGQVHPCSKPPVVSYHSWDKVHSWLFPSSLHASLHCSPRARLTLVPRSWAVPPMPYSSPPLGLACVRKLSPDFYMALPTLFRPSQTSRACCRKHWHPSLFPLECQLHRAGTLSALLMVEILVPRYPPAI